MSLRYCLVTTGQERAACLALRRTVFIEEQSVPEVLERDSDDEAALHFLAYDGDTPVAVGRVVDKGHGLAKVGRVAVLAPYRGKGIGASLMGFILATLAERGFTEVFLHSQEPVVSFYEKLGFVSEGERFFEANIAHFALRKRLYSTG